jgi:DnaJ-class molecular chaperone
MANYNYQQQYKKLPAKVLGVPARASPEEIKKAFRPFLKFHPDKPTGDLEKFQRYSSAYSSLIDSIDILE